MYKFLSKHSFDAATAIGLAFTLVGVIHRLIEHDGFRDGILPILFG